MWPQIWIVFILDNQTEQNNPELKHPAGPAIRCLANFTSFTLSLTHTHDHYPIYQLLLSQSVNLHAEAFGNPIKLNLVAVMKARTLPAVGC